ncbi:unnamed protein product, partial [marine sediment metagenome]
KDGIVLYKKNYSNEENDVGIEEYFISAVESLETEATEPKIKTISMKDGKKIHYIPSK